MSDLEKAIEVLGTAESDCEKLKCARDAFREINERLRLLETTTGALVTLSHTGEPEKTPPIADKRPLEERIDAYLEKTLGNDGSVVPAWTNEVPTTRWFWFYELDTFTPVVLIDVKKDRNREDWIRRNNPFRRYVQIDIPEKPTS